MGPFNYQIEKKAIKTAPIFAIHSLMKRSVFAWSGFVTPLLTVCMATILVLLSLVSDAAAELRGGTEKGDDRVIQLPKPAVKGRVSLEESMAKRSSVRQFKQRALKMEEISQLLWAAYGQTRQWGGKTIPSAGALYPLEIYIATPEGFFHYLPSRHLLQLHTDGNMIPKLSAAALHQDCVTGAPAVFVITAVYERTTRRYGSRGERYVHMEAGHAAQNIHLEAVALELGSVAVGAFNDVEVQRVLGLSKDEIPLYLIPVGEPGLRP
jgi:SagB-type dehydrogenase family enzyme